MSISQERVGVSGFTYIPVLRVRLGQSVKFHLHKTLLRFRVEDEFPQRRWRHHLDQRDEEELEGLGDGRDLSELVEVEDGDQETQDHEVGDLHQPTGDLAKHAGNDPNVS